MENKRSVGIDIIKALAAIFVISIHQLGQTHVLDMNMEGVRAFVIMLFRYTVMSCVPLFIMATGYLQCKKTCDRKFYKGIIPVIVTYLLTTVVIICIQQYLGDPFNLSCIVFNTLRFTQNGYAWYVEMFIGLYLLIPFLNMMFKGSQKSHKVLICILFLITILPSAFIAFSTTSVWLDISPDYWTASYPIFYYVLGSYIRMYQPRIKKGLNVILIIASAILPTVLLFFKANGGEFEPFGYIFNGFNSLSAFLLAFFIFMLFYSADIKFKPVCVATKSISRLSLEIYLLSFIVERLVYGFMDAKFGTKFSMRLWIMITVVFIVSYLTALVFDLVRRGIIKLIKGINNEKNIISG